MRLVCRDGVATLPDTYADHILLSTGELTGEVTPVKEKRRISNVDDERREVIVAP